MVNISKIMSTLIRVLPETEGMAGRLTLGSKQISKIAARGGAEGKMLGKAVEGLREPAIDVAFKAKSNYAVAGLHLKDGERVVQKEAFSLTRPKAGVLDGKYHIEGTEGDILTGSFSYERPVPQNVPKYTPKDKGKIIETEHKKIAQNDLTIPKDKRSDEIIKLKEAKQLEIDWAQEAKKQVIPGVPPPRPVVKIHKPDVLDKLNKLAKIDRAEFERVRQELSKNGFQAYFDPHTGKLDIIEAKDMNEVRAILSKKLQKPILSMSEKDLAVYNRFKAAQYTPEKMHAYKQAELEQAFANFEDKVPLNKREWSEILHSEVDNIINTRFIG